MNKKFDKLLGAIRETDSTLTSDQEAAISGAASPSASNVFATVADLGTTDIRVPVMKVATMTVPIIGVGARVVIDTNLGVLTTKNGVVVNFFKGTASVEEAKRTNHINTQQFQHYIGGGIDTISSNPTYKLLSNIPSLDAGKLSVLIVYEDYTKTMRNIEADNSQEKYGAGVAFPRGWSYAAIGIGHLIGYYGISGNGALGIGGKVICESMWLTQSGNDTILHSAFVNNNNTGSSATSFKVAIYD